MLATHPKVTPTGTRPSCRRTACVHKRHVGRAQPCKAVAASSKQQVQDTHLSQYELIIVGSGNGACAFISKYLTATQSKAQKRILVIEEGQPFLQTSSITHQANWTRSYSEQSIFKLHTTTTGPKAGNRPIISGRAVTQGGGGSINYTMMHESSDWLAQQLGAGGQYSAAYWDTLKQDIGVLFHRRDPAPDRTPVAETLFKALTGNTGGPFADSACEVPDCSKTGYIPQYINGQAPGGALGRVYTFTNQFNDWGERANSGVSLVAGGSDWRRNGRVDLWTDARVEELRFGQCAANGATNGAPPKLPCTGLTIRHLGPKDRIQRVTFNPEQTTVVLAAGSSTPRLLLPHREQLQNYAIGTGVSDHILLPVGFYGLKQDASGDPQVSPKDQYLPLFAEQEVTVPNPSSSGSSRNKAGSTDGSVSSTVVVGYDFFAGPVSELSYYLAHLFVSLWMPNALKTACINNPWLFQQLKLFTAYVIQGVQGVVGCGYGLLSGGRAVPPLNVITGIAKFNIYYNGYYEPQPAQPSNASTRIILKCFATQDDGCCAGDAAASPDGLAAMQTLPTLMRKLDIVGNRPWGWAQWLLKKAVAMPYDPNCQEDIAGYVRKYADQHLLTQQHLAGGCVLGAAAEDGSAGPATVGLVKGTANVVVSDLSAVPLPRVSPQMTAYLLGYHIATQRYGQQAAPAVAEKAQLAAGTAAGSASSAA